MEIYDTDWRAYSYNSSIALYLNNQGIEFDQLIKYNVRDIFLQKNHAEKETGRLVPDLFLFFKKVLYEVKATGLQLSFNHFR